MSLLYLSLSTLSSKVLEEKLQVITTWVLLH